MAFQSLTIPPSFRVFSLVDYRQHLAKVAEDYAIMSADFAHRAAGGEGYPVQDIYRIANDLSNAADELKLIFADVKMRADLDIAAKQSQVVQPLRPASPGRVVQLPRPASPIRVVQAPVQQRDITPADLKLGDIIRVTGLTPPATRYLKQGNYANVANWKVVPMSSEERAGWENPLNVIYIAGYGASGGAVMDEDPDRGILVEHLMYENGGWIQPESNLPGFKVERA